MKRRNDIMSMPMLAELDLVDLNNIIVECEISVENKKSSNNNDMENNKEL